jgi:hypoxanthine phosphoribosyltransferase
MNKIFSPYDDIRNGALKLADKIYKEGFFPDVVYVALRGGAYMGNVISEYFKILCENLNRRPVYYAAVAARSYAGVGKAHKVIVDGWTYSPDYLRNGDKVLLVDDIYDSGQTLVHLANIILDKGIPRQNLKVVVHDYKNFTDQKEPLSITPDYWVRKFDLTAESEPIWIHYLSHELMGLTHEELEKYYYAQDEGLREPLKIFESRK